MINLFTICPHITLLQYYWLYSLYCMLHLRIYLLYNWRFILLIPFTSFLHPLPLPSLLATTFVLWIYEPVFILVFFVCLFCFLDFTYKWDWLFPMCIGMYFLLWETNSCCLRTNPNSLSLSPRTFTFCAIKVHWLNKLTLCECNPFPHYISQLFIVNMLENFFPI